VQSPPRGRGENCQASRGPLPPHPSRNSQPGRRNAEDGARLRLDGIDRVPGLIRNCGGTRDDLPTDDPLHDFTCTDADELPINADNVNYAINSEYQNISPNFFPTYTWDVLAKLDLSYNQNNNVPREQCVEVLEKLLLFEYINGDDKSAGNQSANNRNLQTPWYAVNPVYRELDPFKAAKEKLLKSPEENLEVE